MDVSELGEFGLIGRLNRALGKPADPRLVVGIGDDAAVWQTAENAYVIATTDTLVEGVHFLPGKVAWRDVGWKALAVNVSDIAAMGGAPSFALVTLCVPPEMPVEHLDALYVGLRECAEVYGVTVAGGDVVSSPVFTVTIALTGETLVADGGRPLLLQRSAARMGDVIAVTGPLGGPAGGLRTLIEGTAKEHPSLVEAHMRFWPRVDAGEIAVRAGIRCGIDISDGLVQDLGHICEASRVHADLHLHRVPIDENLLLAYRNDAAAMAATGGEDYELILVGGAEAMALADEALRRHLDMPDVEQLTIVGEITTGPVSVRALDEQGREVEFASGGWDHLQRDALRPRA
jgi:thiamine-monophosphate kinase